MAVAGQELDRIGRHPGGAVGRLSVGGQGRVRDYHRFMLRKKELRHQNSSQFGSADATRAVTSFSTSR